MWNRKCASCEGELPQQRPSTTTETIETAGNYETKLQISLLYELDSPTGTDRYAKL